MQTETGEASGEAQKPAPAANGSEPATTAATAATATTTTSAAAAAAPTDSDLYTVPLWINGHEIHTPTTFDVISPTTHHVIGHASSASLADAATACAAASSAFPAWSRTRPRERRDILLRAAAIMESRTAELGGYMEAETGASGAWAGGLNVPLACEMLRDAAGRISGVCGWVPTCAEEGVAAMVLREPVGVVLGIAPWNAPLVLGLRAFLPAVATGNTVILKGSELSPRTTWALGSVLHAAGLPPGVLNVLHHRPADAAAVTEALIAHPAVRKVNFTGSTAVGRIIAATAGKHLKPVLLELGGKASAIVLEDADLELAAHWNAVGAFLHAGQICMSTERILVHRAVSTEFTRLLLSEIAKIYPTSAPPAPVVTPAGLAKTHALVSSALAAGATLLAGTAEKESQTRMRPVVVGGVREDMAIYATETFGPAVVVLEVEGEEEAVRVANDTEYGLSAAVFTRDLARGLRVARALDSGAVHINGMTVHDEAALPHGGVKSSGFGRFGGHWGFDEFLRCKTVTYRE